VKKGYYWFDLFFPALHDPKVQWTERALTRNKKLDS
jgi:hypothetical protein